MSRAIELAERGRGAVEPNPLVGAVVVRDGALVGEGWHERFGGPHAEVNALTAAGQAARGATLYVTLEPCCHLGKTPPCTEAVLRARISRVVAAMADPAPHVAGKGAAALRAQGLTVEIGSGEAAARRQNAAYLKLLATGRPYVHAKWAMTLDGKIATRTGQSKWISSHASRDYVHALRGRMDAVIVGSGTALADDPLLTARPPGPRTPTRVVVCGSRRLDPQCKLLNTLDVAPLLVACTDGDGVEGCEVVKVPGKNGRCSVVALLDELGRRRFTNVLVEGGSALLGSFLDAKAIDEVHVFVAPRLFGGSEALTPIGGRGVGEPADAFAFNGCRVESIGGDVLIHGWTDTAG